RPQMPPAALMSSTRSWLPCTMPSPRFLNTPDSSVIAPRVISVSVTPGPTFTPDLSVPVPPPDSDAPFVPQPASASAPATSSARPPVVRGEATAREHRARNERGTDRARSRAVQPCIGSAFPSWPGPQGAQPPSEGRQATGFEDDHGDDRRAVDELGEDDRGDRAAAGAGQRAGAAGD